MQPTEGPPPIAAASVPPATDEALEAPETTPAGKGGAEIQDLLQGIPVSLQS